jgi:hypothetical protein
MTVWKQAFVLGGAVLLLAACDRATGPSTQLQQKDPAAANLIFRLPGTTTTVSPTNPPPGTEDGCRSGYSVSSGRLVEMSLNCVDELISDQ